MKLSNFFLLGSFGVTQGQDMGGSLGLQFDAIWPVLMNMANIPKDALFWPYLLCGQKMCPMLLYSMIKVKIKPGRPRIWMAHREEWLTVALESSD